MRPRITAQCPERFLRGDALRRLALDRDDAIAGENARLLCRCGGERSDHGDAGIANVHLYADTSVLPARALVETVQAPRAEEDRVRVAQLAQRTVNGVTIQRGVGERVHIVAPNALQHLVEEMRARREILAGRLGPALHEPAAGDEGAGQHCGGNDGPVLH